jgi:nucleotide-binding universal stress UspA family protein
MRTLDQAESYPSPGQPERRRRREQHGHDRLDHPVVVGYDGSPCSRNALAYAAGVARRLGRSLLIGAPSRSWRHLGGSVPSWLTRHPRCPLIVVP